MEHLEWMVFLAEPSNIDAWTERMDVDREVESWYQDIGGES